MKEPILLEAVLENVEAIVDASLDNEDTEESSSC